MTAADWLTSDAVTEALARLKREREAEEAGCCEVCGESLADQEAHSCCGQTLCEDCWTDATGGKA